MSGTTSDKERLTRIETEQKHISNNFSEFSKQVKEDFSNMESSLDGVSSTFASFTEEMSNLGKTLATIALNGEHMEKSVLKEVSGLRTQISQYNDNFVRFEGEYKVTITNLSDRLSELEKGAEWSKGFQDAAKINRSWWVSNWFNIFKVVMMLSGGIGVVIAALKMSGKT